MAVDILTWDNRAEVLGQRSAETQKRCCICLYS